MKYPVRYYLAPDGFPRLNYIAGFILATWDNILGPKLVKVYLFLLFFCIL